MLRKIHRNQRYIYVLLSRTRTVPARLIRFFTGEPYSHTSIALDMELTELYSFARRNMYNPFDSGFVDEDIETGIFGSDKNIFCSVYAIPVTDEQYEKVCQEIKGFVQNKELYNYNYVGLVGALFGKNVTDEKRYFCSQFVSHILSRSGIHIFQKEDELIRPYDFHRSLKENRIYKGKLSEYREYLQQYQNMDYLDEEYVHAM